MADVRETIDHLVGLGRFEDVRVDADAGGARASRCARRLVPVRRIGDVSIDRPASALPATDDPRASSTDRFGATPSAGRAAEMAAARARDFYAERGYRGVAVDARC